MGKSYRQHRISVTIDKFHDGSADATVWVRLRSGDDAAAFTAHWPTGAPTPHQLDLLSASFDDELQALVLTVCGVQGALLPLGDVVRQLGAEEL